MILSLAHRQQKINRKGKAQVLSTPVWACQSLEEDRAVQKSFITMQPPSSCCSSLVDSRICHCSICKSEQHLPICQPSCLSQHRFQILQQDAQHKERLTSYNLLTKVDDVLLINATSILHHPDMLQILPGAYDHVAMCHMLQNNQQQWQGPLRVSFAKSKPDLILPPSETSIV